MMRDTAQFRTSAAEVLATAAGDFLSAQTPLLEARLRQPCALAERTLAAYQDISPLLRLASCRLQIGAGVPVVGIQKELETVKHEFQVLEDRIDDARRTTTSDNLRQLFGEAMLRVHSARTLVDLAMRLLDQANDQPSA